MLLPLTEVSQPWRQKKSREGVLYSPDSVCGDIGYSSSPYIQCAEGSQCSCNGGQVRFGAGFTWSSYQQFHGNFSCAASTFGMGSSNVARECQCHQVLSASKSVSFSFVPRGTFVVCHKQSTPYAPWRLYGLTTFQSLDIKGASPVNFSRTLSSGVK